LRLGDWSVARDMMSSLLGRERAVNGTSHPETLQLELNLAQVQLVLGDAAAALSILNRIYPDFITVYGPEHRLTVGLLGERANAFEDLGRYNDAFSDQMHAYHIAAHTDGAHSYVALGSLTDTGSRAQPCALGICRRPIVVRRRQPASAGRRRKSRFVPDRRGSIFTSIATAQ
jgi:hypothetical protein